MESNRADPEECKARKGKTKMTDQEKIHDALRWFGMHKDSKVDICENGQVYVGLTEILPRNSVRDIGIPYKKGMQR